MDSLPFCHCNEHLHFLLPFLSFEWSSFLFWPNSEFLPSFIQIVLSWILSSSRIFLAIWPYVIESHRKDKVCHHRTVRDSNMFLAFPQPLTCKTLVVSWHQESQTDDHFFLLPTKPDAKLTGTAENMKGFGLGPNKPARNNAEKISGSEMVQRN